MDYETLGDSQNTFPAEAIKEIKTMCKWMTFTAVLLIIISILGILGNLGNFSSTGNAMFLFSIFMNGVSIYLYFMILKKSGFFNAFAESHDEVNLIAALNTNKIYWMVSTLIMIFSFLLTLINR